MHQNCSSTCLGVLIRIYPITRLDNYPMPYQPYPWQMSSKLTVRGVSGKWGVVKGKKRHVGKLLPFKKMPPPPSEAAKAVNRTPPTVGESPEFQELMDRYLELADSALQPGHLETSPQPPGHIHFKAN